MGRNERGSGGSRLVRASSPVAGSFSPGGFEGRPRRRSGRIAALAALVLSVVWFSGFASLFAVPLSILALSSGSIGRGYRWAAVAGLVLGIGGLVLSAALMVRAGGVDTL